MRNAFILILALTVCISFAQLSYGADPNVPGGKAATGQAAKKAPPAGPAGAPRMLPRPNFAMIFGTVTKIDKADPQKITMEVKNENDNMVHTVDLPPTVNVTKVIDVAELNTGDTVRVMARKIENKEVAMNIVTGKIKNLPMRRPVMQAPPGQTSGPAKVMQAPPKK